jgi:AcrR family transcriptional regulator
VSPPDFRAGFFLEIIARLSYNVKEVWFMANFTEKAIKETFITLLNEKPLNKITVKDISEKCGINRNTFYYHYTDIPALLEVVLTEQAEIIISDGENASLYELLIHAVDFAIENKTAVYHIHKSASREMFETYLERITEKEISSYVEKKALNYNTSKVNKEAIIHYYKCLLMGIVIDWLSGGMQYELQDKLRIICELFEGSMEKALERGKAK